jgi:transcriptional regulator with XRE-family HTH domain
MVKKEQKGISQDRLSKLADISLNTIAKLELDET